MPVPLLTTKLYIPPPRARQVARPHLFARLEDGLCAGRRLILLSAPAGFGKTTLLSEWIARRSGPERFCWLSLDEGDNDPARFLRYVAAAFETVDPRLSEPLQALLQTPLGAEGLVSPEGVLNALINQLAGYAYPLCVVLDDFHVIDAPVIHAALAYLLDHLPPQVHLVIATRADPPLPFSRLRARDQIVELRVADLRFSEEEAAAFLTGVMQLDLSAEHIAALEARTEGWIAGLQLATLAMQGVLAVQSEPDPEALSAFIAAFAGSNRYILDYLVEEVFTRQPADVQDFLMQTAVLDRFCAELCEAVMTSGVTTVSAAGCQSILEALERSNLFLVPLDGDRRWYRYHNLFGEFLRARLESVTEKPQMSLLHLRASAWFEAQDLPPEAIEYALRAADYHRAADLIERKARWSVLTPGETGKMLRWLEAVPSDVARRHPGLCLTHAWALLAAGRNPAVDPFVQMAMDAPGVDSAMQSEAAAIRSLLAVMSGRLDEAVTLAHQALENLPDDAALMRSMVALNLGLAYDMRGEPAAATPIYREAVSLGQSAGNVLIALIGAVQLADLELLQGRLAQAEAAYRQAVTIADRLGNLPVTGMAYSGMAHILYECNRLEEAASQAEKAIEMGRNWESSDILAVSLVYLAQVRAAQGRIAEALELAERVSAALEGNISSSSSIYSIRAYQARVWLRTGRLEAAAQWASEYQQKPDTFPQAYLRVIEGATLIRVRLAEGQPAQAVEAAAQLLPCAQAGEAIELNALEALGLHALGQEDAAAQALHAAITLAEPEDASEPTYTRVFIDEGAPMAALLRQALARGVCPAYTHALLAALVPCAAAEPPDVQPGLVEPLSDREIEILCLIAAGLSNAQIAERLVVAVSTVKTHINNLYGKLGVQTRTQAISRARAVGLLS